MFSAVPSTLYEVHPIVVTHFRVTCINEVCKGVVIVDLYIKRERERERLMRDKKVEREYNYSGRGREKDTEERKRQREMDEWRENYEWA